MSGQRQSRLYYYIGSAVELLSNSFFTMSQVSYVVAVGVVFENIDCLTSVEPLMFEGYDKQSLNLRNGQSRSFFLNANLMRRKKSCAKNTYSMCRCQLFHVRCS